MRRPEADLTSKRVAFFNLPVVDIFHNPQKDWSKLVASVNGSKRFASHQMQVDWKRYNPGDFLFSHCSIVASVQTEADGFSIVEPCEELINANGNAWTNAVLPHCFRTFVGGENYFEHVQIPELSKGKILDAVLRPVTYVGKSGKKAEIFYVDILVATNRRHESIISRVSSGELSTLSMGCLANFVQCSGCGKIFGDNDQSCQHLENYLKRYTNVNGIRKVIAELVGAVDKNGNYIDESCVYIEASWVENPAFGGAVVNFLIETPTMQQDRQLQAALEQQMENIFLTGKYEQLRVADMKSALALRLMVQEVRKQRMQGLVARVAAKS